VRCECGNPLTPPQPVPTTPTYTGPRWPDFDPTVIIVIQQTTVIIEEFILIDIYTGDRFVRPTGTAGEQDAVKQATAWTLTVELVYRWGEFEWTADIVVNPGGTIGGTAQAVWHANGYTWTNDPDNWTGTWTAEVYCPVTVVGTIEDTPTGRMLHITPVPGTVTWSDLVIVDDPSLRDDQKASIESQIPGWMEGLFVETDLPAVDEGPVLATVNFGPEQGSATLTAR